MVFPVLTLAIFSFGVSNFKNRDVKISFIIPSAEIAC
jgi:hypothetical protein